MIKCLVIDDEPLAVEQLKQYIFKVPYLELVSGCMNAFEAMAYIQKDNIDAIFIDINMPDLNGLDFVKTLINPPLVVITTAYSKYAIEGYKIDAIDYLLKPFSFIDFQRAANKIQNQFNLRNILTETEIYNKKDTSFNDDSIYIKNDYKIIKIILNEIIYIEGMSEYLKIYLINKDRPIIAHLSMKKLEEMLPKSIFMRIHKSYIINLCSIKEINKIRVVLNGEASIPIGDVYKDKFFFYVNQKSIVK